MGFAFRFGCLWPALAATLATAHAQAPAADIAELLDANGVDPTASAMLVVRLDDGGAPAEEWASNPERVEQRFVPASTSKIPHTLIALETGYVDGPETRFKWDGVERAFDPWNRDQTLATAYGRSAVWVYQQIANDLGHDTMASWISRFDYGNADIGGPEMLTRYWLDGPLAISAREQVAFLARLARDDLPLAPGTLRTGKAIMRADGNGEWSLYAKTGWGLRPDEPDIGWYVGWVEHVTGELWVFALNLDMPDPDIREKRIPVVRAVLAAVGATP